jgi:hypothetical protein
VIKRWWNRRFPFYRLCGHRWCLRVMTYDYRCAWHQGTTVAASTGRSDT